MNRLTRWRPLRFSVFRSVPCTLYAAAAFFGFSVRPLYPVPCTRLLFGEVRAAEGRQIQPSAFTNTIQMAMSDRSRPQTDRHFHGRFRRVVNQS